MLFDVVLERGASVATPFRGPGHLTVNRILSSGDSLGHLRFTQPSQCRTEDEQFIVGGIGQV